jgi:glycerol-3-phosphate dehydrogenase
MKRDINALAEGHFDLVVIGGGIHGAWIAWDAALRGLSVALIERGDYGQETSANSLKTIHGGLRYLQDANLRLVSMMIQERSAYLRVAPHLVHPLPCLVPTYTGWMRSKPVMGAALLLNDLFGRNRNQHLDEDRHIPPGRLISRQECLRVLPGIVDKGITGGAVWYDGQVYNSERLTLSLIKSAVVKGAIAANYVEARGFLQDGSRVKGVVARDVQAGSEFEIRSRQVINTAGPWVDQVLDGLPLQKKEKKFRHSLAMNIVTDRLIHGYGAGIPSWPGKAQRTDKKGSHMLFVSPWRDRSIIGTFHAHFQGDPGQFRVREEKLQEILDEFNSGYPGAGLTLEDIRFVHKGFLPEIGSGSQEVQLVRSGRVIDHRAEDGLQGLITVVGVKYTSARQVAEKAVDLVFEQRGVPAPICMTRITRLTDGQIDSFSGYLERALKEAGGSMDPQLVEALVKNYGSDYPSLKRRIQMNNQPRPELAHGVGGPVRLAEGGEASAWTPESGPSLKLDSPEVLKAQIQHAVEEEMAITLSDVIFRRTGLGSAGRPGRELLRTCAWMMGEILGWDQAKRELEIESVEAIYTSLGV